MAQVRRGGRLVSDRIVDHEAWPARAALLACLGVVLGVALDLALRVGGYRWSEDPLRLSIASLIAAGGITFAFTFERVRWLWSLVFALGCGVVVALVPLWNGSPTGWSEGDEWRVVASILSVAIAAPLFQTVRDEGRPQLGYAQVHAHAWTNLVLWFACWAFVLVTYLLAQLLAELFQLIGIGLLRDALRKGWFTAGLMGGAFGAAAGLLRDRDKVLGLLQRVVTTVLSVLAPILAAGLVIFVVALPIAGLTPLWEKTSATTPILLLAVAGAFVLANAVIGNSPEEEAEGRILRLSARALAAVMAPLAGVAAISTWLRIDQHGFTPERLWALVFVTVVLAVSLTYLWIALRGGRDWSARIRPANVRLAMGICAVALILATPIANFGAISARDQVARLQSGKIKPEEFDWAALRFDFGPSGERALSRLAASGSATLREPARKALAMTDRLAARVETRVGQDLRRLSANLRVLPQQVPVPEPLGEAIARPNTCSFGRCVLVWRPGERGAVAVGFPCEGCQPTASRLLIDEGGLWQVVSTSDFDRNTPPSREQLQAIERGQVEVRAVRRRQVFVGGKPIGEPFE